MIPELHVLVIAFGRADDLALCLRRLGDAASITVIDNSSSEVCKAVVEAAHAAYIDPQTNLGFAGGVNRGLAALGSWTPDVLLLNPDALIDEPSVNALHARLRSAPRAAAVAPSLIGMDGAPQRVSWPFPTPARMWLEAVGLGRLGRGSCFLVGAILLLRSEAIAEVGGFDERFFLYAEEADWQRRAVDAGWEVVYCPEIVGCHRGAGSSDDAELREVRFHCAAEMFIRKWHGSRGWLVYRTAACAAAIVRSARLDPARRAEARRRALLYLRGPCRRLAARLPDQR